MYNDQDDFTTDINILYFMFPQKLINELKIQ